MRVNHPALVRALGRPGTWFDQEPKGRSAHLQSLILSCVVGVSIGLLYLISPWIALACLLGLVLLFTALVKPVILCYAIVAATTLLSGIARGRVVPFLALNEVCLLLSTAIALFVILASRRRGPTVGRYFEAAFVLLIGGVVVIPIVVYKIQGVDLNFNNAFKMIAPIQYFLLFWLFFTLPEGEKDRRSLIRWMLVCGSIVAVVGLLQAVRLGPVISLLQGWYTSEHEMQAADAGRVTSLLGTWNALGILMTFTFLIGWTVLPETETPADRIITMVSMALVAVCLVASGSYSSLGSLVIGVLLIQILAPRKLEALPILIASAAAIGIAIVALLPILQPMVDTRLAYQYRLGGEVPQTLAFRLHVWQDIFIPAILQHFPWPVAPTVPAYFGWQFEENQYILLLFRTGLAGLLGYLGWTALTFGWLFRRLRRNRGFTKAMVAVSIALVAVVTVAGLTNEIFSFSGSAEYLWIMLAFVANSIERPL